jgi:putative DNA methylase
MIQFTKGDLFERPADIRVNTVNCVGVMGAGVALAFKTRYPDMFRDYKKACARGDVQPGKLHIWRGLTGEQIVNFPTKRHWREKSRYEDIQSGLIALRDYLAKQGAVTVSLPALGCGHGGLDWNRVSKMIGESLDGLAATILVFEPGDSREAGQKVHRKFETEVAERLRKLGFHSSELSRRLDAAGNDAVFVRGDDELLRNVFISFASSGSPEEREKEATLACIEELASHNIVFSFNYDKMFSEKAVAKALSKGSRVVLWVQPGSNDFYFPSSLENYVDEGRISFAALAPSRYGERFVEKTQALKLAFSEVGIITEPQPRWIRALPKTLSDEPKLFYFRYRETDPQITKQLESLSAKAISRNSKTNRPNVAPLLQFLASTHSLHNNVDESQTPVRTETESIALKESASAAFPMSNVKYPKRLIEVDLPIRRISEHARREKSIRHGHISTLHIWWARRPLAACRAVICASLWPDPADPLCPDSFRTAAREQMLKMAELALGQCSTESYHRFVKYPRHPEKLDDLRELRSALLDFIADFANWDNSTNELFLKISRALTQAAHEALGGAPGTRPLVVDPFCGGGSIPLEALRVGADAFASDLNPIPVLLNKVILEYIPKYGERLSDGVLRWGEWVKREAEKELRVFYPTDADGSVPIAYLWARTIRCEGPACGVVIPLIRSLWLAKHGKNRAYLRIFTDRESKTVNFEIVRDLEGATEGTIKNGAATCPCCGYTTANKRVRAQLEARHGGASDARLYAVVCVRPDAPGRTYRLATAIDVENAANAARELARRIVEEPNYANLIPDELIPSARPSPNARGLSAVTRIGIKSFRDLYTPRQLLGLTSIARLISKLGDDAAKELDPVFAGAVQTCLALNLSKLTDLATSIGAWEPNVQTVQHVFGRQALPICWDFAEGNLLGESRGSWSTYLKTQTSMLPSWANLWETGHVEQFSATEHSLPDDSANYFITDPPYYDAIPYADLSDFFYVWLKRCLKQVHGEIVAEVLTPKEEEAIWNPSRLYSKTGQPKDEAFYERQLARAFAEGRRILRPDGLGMVVFAHKSTAGWEAVLSALVNAGWVATASWPIDTELETRVNAMGTASLASSVHLVCRPREKTNGSLSQDVGDWRDVLQELPRRIHEWMPRLTDEGVVGADAIFACLGPALEIFSRYTRVEKSNGDPVPLKDYLEHVWAAVSKEALSVIFEGAETEGFEPDARLTAMWLWTLTGGKSTAENAEEDEGGDEDGSEKQGKVKSGFSLEYDAARKIAQGLGANLEDLRSMVEVSGETARLLPVAERTGYLFGKDQVDQRVEGKRKKKPEAQQDLFATLAQEGVTEQVWSEKTVSRIGETTLDRIHQSMILFAAGRSEALKRFLVDDGAGRDQKFWRLAQALSALYPPKSEEKRWVDGVLARKKGLGF